MLVSTPIEFHDGFAVKREDKSCPLIPISKMRGLIPHIRSRREKYIGVTDTFRSWNGLCAAIACSALNKRAIIFYPRFTRRPDAVPPIHAYARDQWSAELVPTPANRQAQMLFYAKTWLALLDEREVYMLNTGFRFKETSTAVAEEVEKVLRSVVKVDTIVVPTGTGTHLRGVVAGARGRVKVIAHLGYSQNHERLRRFVNGDIDIIDESFDYRDRVDLETPFDANPYYETKTWRWMKENLKPSLRTLLWNIGGKLPAAGLKDYDKEVK